MSSGLLRNPCSASTSGTGRSAGPAGASRRTVRPARSRRSPATAENVPVRQPALRSDVAEAASRSGEGSAGGLAPHATTSSATESTIHAEAAAAGARRALRREALSIAMRLLHTMLRVNDLEESLRFYCDVLGMTLLRKKDFPSGRFTLAFVGYGPEDQQAVLEFTYNWDTHAYDLGTAYGHVALGVDGIHETVERLRAKGAKVTREPGPMKHGGSTIAFIEDPNGYKVELIELRGRED